MMRASLCEKCGEVFDTYTSPPKCSGCGVRGWKYVKMGHWDRAQIIARRYGMSTDTVAEALAEIHEDPEEAMGEVIESPDLIFKILQNVEV